MTSTTMSRFDDLERHFNKHFNSNCKICKNFSNIRNDILRLHVNLVDWVAQKHEEETKNESLSEM